LKAFPKSTHIWAVAVELEPEHTRKKKASSAIEVCGQSAWINSSVGKLFWRESKLEKAKKWFEEALKLSPNNGDVWAFYIRLLDSHFPSEKEEAISKMMQLEDNF
jgi:pre-mRNA-processing factor 6